MRLGLKRVVACMGAGLRAAPHERSSVYILCLCFVVCVSGDYYSEWFIPRDEGQGIELLRRPGFGDDEETQTHKQHGSPAKTDPLLLRKPTPFFGVVVASNRPRKESEGKPKREHGITTAS